MKALVSANAGKFSLPLGEINYTVLTKHHEMKSQDIDYFDATSVIRQYNSDIDADIMLGFKTVKRKKRLDNFLRNTRTKQIMAKIEKDPCANSRMGKLVKIVQNGEAKEIWLHLDLFLHLMIWLDAEHEVAVVKFVQEVLGRIEGALLIRKEEKAAQLPTMDEVKRVQKMLEDEGSGAAPNYYSTVNSQIYTAATGLPSSRGGVNHNNLPDDVTAAIKRIRFYLLVFIANHLDEGVLTGREIKNEINAYLHALRDEKRA